ncbi:MAG: hypothetical protein INF98_11295 [Roseomonas sp.]|nr:hypothetical protein [Roseomonas sp.]
MSLLPATTFGHPKSVFRPIYLLLTAITLWQIGHRILADLFTRASAGDILSSFVGDQNVDTARMLIAFFTVVTLFYFFLVYLLSEGFEERSGRIGGQIKTVRNRYWLICEFFARFLIVALVVFGPKFLPFDTYERTWDLLLWLSGAYCFWTLIVWGCYGIKSLDHTVYAFFIASTCLAVKWVVSDGAGTRFALLTILIMFLLSIILTGFILHQIRKELPGMMVSLGKWLVHWDIERAPSPRSPAQSSDP